MARRVEVRKPGIVPPLPLYIIYKLLIVLGLFYCLDISKGADTLLKSISTNILLVSLKVKIITHKWQDNARKYGIIRL